jgi:hypothetical protein
VQGEDAVVAYPDNMVYRGPYKNARREGHGSMARGKTVQYIGNWYNDRRHGRGKQRYGKNFVDHLWKNGVMEM